MNKLLSFIYNLIRPLFVEDIDPNEDFVCGKCSKPVLTRVLFCSKRCEDLFDYEQKIQSGIDHLKEVQLSIKTEERPKLLVKNQTNLEDGTYTGEVVGQVITTHKTYLLYCPELDIMIEDTRESGYIFKNEYGEFHLRYFMSQAGYRKHKPFKPYEFYIIGEL